MMYSTYLIQPTPSGFLLILRVHVHVEDPHLSLAVYRLLCHSSCDSDLRPSSLKTWMLLDGATASLFDVPRLATLTNRVRHTLPHLIFLSRHNEINSLPLQRPQHHHFTLLDIGQYGLEAGKIEVDLNKCVVRGIVRSARLRLRPLRLGHHKRRSLELRGRGPARWSSFPNRAKNLQEGRAASPTHGHVDQSPLPVTPSCMSGFE